MYEPGDVIDRNYRVSRRLAMGGAGVTYLVRSVGDDGEEVGPWIALKLLFASRDSGAYLRRLATEAQILQELHHPNIVEYLGFVHRTGQSPYLLTQFEEGGSLLDHMKRVGTMGVREAAAVGRQVCMALEKGHAQDITHRDLKPENLLLCEVTSKGEVPRVRVADFGIAKVTGSIGAGLTRVGAFVGTPQYAAPEQFVGHPATDKSDVYALGAVMVFMMTARPIVPNAHKIAPEDVYCKLMEILPPAISRKSDTVEDCERINLILARAMTIEPKDRCSVSELFELLSEFLDVEDTPYRLEENPEPEFIEPGSITQMATVQGTPGSSPVSPLPKSMPTPTIKDPDEDSSLRFAPSSQDSHEQELDSPSDGGEESSSESLVEQNNDASQAIVDPQPVPKTARRVLRMMTMLTVVFGIIALAGVYVLFPLGLDWLPGRGGWPVDGITDRAAGYKGRIAGKNAWKRSRKDIRTACPQAKGRAVELEAVINIEGSIRWARPIDWGDAEAWCVAFELGQKNSGYTLKSPSKVKLTVRP